MNVSHRDDECDKNDKPEHFVYEAMPCSIIKMVRMFRAMEILFKGEVGFVDQLKVNRSQ